MSIVLAYVYDLAAYKYGILHGEMAYKGLERRYEIVFHV